MGNAFNPKPGCVIPPIEAITPLHPNTQINTPPSPIVSFPIFEFPPPLAPPFAFGCTTPAVVIDLQNTNEDPSFQLVVDDTTDPDRGACHPTFDFHVSIPNCVDLNPGATIHYSTDGSLLAGFTASPGPGTRCSRILDLQIIIPRDPCVTLQPFVSVEDAQTAAFSVSVHNTHSDPNNCERDIFFDLQIPPCVTIKPVPVIVQGTDTEPHILFKAVRDPAKPCQVELDLEIVLPQAPISNCTTDVATTKNLDVLGGFQQIDGITVGPGMSILVKDQHDKSFNAPYFVNPSGDWTVKCAPLHSGLIVSVTSGKANGGKAFMLTAPSSPDPVADGEDKPFQEVGSSCCCSCRVVAITEQSLSGTPTIDGISLQSGDTVLLTAQGDQSQNGPYVINDDGSWDRTCELFSGMLVSIREGMTRLRTIWILVTNGTIDADSTDQDWHLVRPASMNVIAADHGTSGTMDGQTISENTKVLAFIDQPGVYIFEDGKFNKYVSFDTGDDPDIVGFVISVAKGNKYPQSGFIVTDSDTVRGFTPFLASTPQTPNP